MELKNAGYGPVSTMTMGVLSLEVKRLIAWLIKYIYKARIAEGYQVHHFL
jgi:hypothetical protein